MIHSEERNKEKEDLDWKKKKKEENQRKEKKKIIE
jgi:hypothetical protein